MIFYKKQNKEDTWTCQSPCALSVRARNVEVKAYTSHSRFRKTVWNIFSCMLSSELICLLYFVQWSYSDSDLAISFKERHAAHIAWPWYNRVSISRIDFKSIEKLFNVIHIIQSNWSHVNNIIINSHLLVLLCLPMSMVACTESRIVTY